MTELELRSDLLGPDFSTYRLALDSLVCPPAISLGFATANLICALLLGHPRIAAAGFLGTCLLDFAYQRRLAAWRASPSSEQKVGIGRLALVCGLRHQLLLAPAISMAVIGGGPELAFLGVVACSIAVLSNSYGFMSRAVYWACAGPALFSGLATILFKFAGPPAAGVALGFGMLGVLMWMISEGTNRGLSQWYGVYVDSVALNAELEKARNDAHQANIAKSNFLATMSHEIRTPLNGILGLAQLMRREERDGPNSQRLDVLLDCGEHLLSVLNDILDATKIDAGRVEIRRAPERLADFFLRAVGFWSARAEEKELRLNIQGAEALPEVAALDAQHLRQVLFNLLGNALKFTERGGVTLRVEVLQRPDGDILAFEVADTGPGIPAENLATLFNRFSQADSTATRRFGGTGLGLAIARHLTRLMGGDITVASTLGVGSTFRVELPVNLIPAEQQPDTRAEPDSWVEDGMTEADCGLDFLVVDDNPTNLLVLDSLLSALGQKVTRASGGREALELMAVQRFDAVMMDVHMPAMSGIEAVEQLRASAGPNRETKVIAVTADVVSGGAERYLGLGFDGHCSKPIQIDELVRAISSLRPTKQESAA